MIREDVDVDYATVGAVEDIDGACRYVIFCPNRTAEEAERIELQMDAKTARALARRLNRWAKLVTS